MSYVQEEKDIQQLFESEWALQPITTPIEFDNSEDLSETETFVRLSILGGFAFQADLGKPTNTYRHNGTIIVQIFVSLQRGTALVKSLADQVANIFRTRFIGSGIVTKTPMLDRVGPNSTFYQMNVMIPFHRDTIF